MIKGPINIENYRSIKALQLSPKRINLFIGDSHTGKSNILSALGILAIEPNRSHQPLRNVGSGLDALKRVFHNESIQIPVTVSADGRVTKIYYKNDHTLELIIEETGDKIDLVSTSDANNIDWFSSENRDYIYTLDNPFSKSFPPQIKQWAEQISFDVDNQYFIATHNHYLIDTLILKNLKEDLAVFITYSNRISETKLKEIPVKEFPMIIDLGPDIFFNLDKFL